MSLVKPYLITLRLCSGGGQYLENFRVLNIQYPILNIQLTSPTLIFNRFPYFTLCNANAFYQFKSQASDKLDIFRKGFPTAPPSLAMHLQVLLKFLRIMNIITLHHIQI